MFYVTKTKECRGKKKTFVLSSSLRFPDPYLLFKSPRAFFPPWGPWTSYQPAWELTLSLYIYPHLLLQTFRDSQLIRTVERSISWLILYLSSYLCLVSQISLYHINSVTQNYGCCSRALPGMLFCFVFQTFYFVLEYTQLTNNVVVKKETDRTGSVLKAGLHLGLDCGLWAICPVSMETTYQLENQAPPDGRTPGLIPRLSIA